MSVDPAPDLLRCPTCSAAQAASAECRRCKCDLSLYVAALEHRRACRQRTLAALRAGRYDEALDAAHQYAALTPDQDAVRWIAVAHALSGDFAAALRAAAPPHTAGRSAMGGPEGRAQR